MKLTGAAILASRGMKVLQAAPAAYPYRSATEAVMSDAFLIKGRTEDATRISKAASLKKWPHLQVDPVLDMVPLAKLCVFLTGDKYDDTVRSFVNQMPKQPDVEPWDFENLS